jgi:hypothetical protein
LRLRKAEQSEIAKGRRIAALDDFCRERIRWAEQHLRKRALTGSQTLTKAAQDLFRGLSVRLEIAGSFALSAILR